MGFPVSFEYSCYPLKFPRACVACGRSAEQALFVNKSLSNNTQICPSCETVQPKGGAAILFPGTSLFVGNVSVALVGRWAVAAPLNNPDGYFQFSIGLVDGPIEVVDLRDETIIIYRKVFVGEKPTHFFTGIFSMPAFLDLRKDNSRYFLILHPTNTNQVIDHSLWLGVRWPDSPFDWPSSDFVHKHIHRGIKIRDDGGRLQPVSLGFALFK